MMAVFYGLHDGRGRAQWNLLSTFPSSLLPHEEVLGVVVDQTVPHLVDDSSRRLALEL